MGKTLLAGSLAFWMLIGCGASDEASQSRLQYQIAPSDGEVCGQSFRCTYYSGEKANSVLGSLESITGKNLSRGRGLQLDFLACYSLDEVLRCVFAQESAANQLKVFSSSLKESRVALENLARHGLAFAAPQSPALEAKPLSVYVKLSKLHIKIEENSLQNSVSFQVNPQWYTRTVSLPQLREIFEYFSNRDEDIIESQVDTQKSKAIVSLGTVRCSMSETENNFAKCSTVGFSERGAALQLKFIAGSVVFQFARILENLVRPVQNNWSFYSVASAFYVEIACPSNMAQQCSLFVLK